MAHQHDHQREDATPEHSHNCGGLFGCGDEKGTGVVREDIKDGAFDKRVADRLLHMDEVEQEQLDGFLTARGRARRQLLRASSFMGALAAVGPWFGKIAQAAGASDTASATTVGGGRVHVVDSNKETVRLGVFDATLPPILTVESGDAISFPNTWSHFLNELEPGVPISRLAELRTGNPGRGPHSIIGPIAVKDAEPGDVIEIRYKRLHPVNWGAVFNNPASLGTGLLPQDFAQGQIKYVDLDLAAMQGKFAPDINIPLTPFQGTLGVAPPDGFFPPLSPGVTNSVPPGPHGGNLDLRELAEGSTLYLPVWQPGALIYTGDFACRARRWRDQPHRARNPDAGGADPGRPAQAKEVSMAGRRDGDALDHRGSRQGSRHGDEPGGAQRHRVSLDPRQADPHDAYALCSIAVSFRVTQVVDIVRGVHAMIPKNLFTGELRGRIAVV